MRGERKGYPMAYADDPILFLSFPIKTSLSRGAAYAFYIIIIIIVVIVR